MKRCPFCGKYPQYLKDVKFWACLNEDCIIHGVCVLARDWNRRIKEPSGRAAISKSIRRGKA